METFIFHFSGDNIDNPQLNFLAKEGNILHFNIHQIAKYSLFSLYNIFKLYVPYFKMFWREKLVLNVLLPWNKQPLISKSSIVSQTSSQREKWTHKYIQSIYHIHFKLPAFWFFFFLNNCCQFPLVLMKLHSVFGGVKSYISRKI